MIGRLDRYLAMRAAMAALLLCLALITVFIVIDVLVNLNILFVGKAEVAASERLSLVFGLYLDRLPQLINFALPVSALGAALLVCAPMLRRGEFTALGAGGIGPRRATRVLLAVALIIGCADGLVADLLTPHATASANAREDRLRGMAREGRSWLDPATGTSWFAGSVSLVGRDADRQPVLSRVAAASPDQLVYAERAEWRQGRWRLMGDVARMQIGADRLVRCDRPVGMDASALGLVQPPAELYRMLLPRFTMRSDELADRGAPGDMGVVWGRWLRVVMPLAMVLMAMPVFVRFLYRDRLVIGVIRGVAVGVVPAAVIVVGGIATEGARQPAVVAIGTAVLAISPGLWLWLRWRL